jgi:rRNA-processing protein FCF1
MFSISLDLTDAVKEANEVKKQSFIQSCVKNRIKVLEANKKANNYDLEELKLLKEAVQDFENEM